MNKYVMAPIVGVYGILLVMLFITFFAFLSFVLFFVFVAHWISNTIFNKDDIPGWAEQFGTWLFDGLDHLGDSINYLCDGWYKLLRAWKDVKK